MNSGLFTFILLASVVLCTGVILIIALLRAAWIKREREALTSTDLRALEESAMILIEQMKAEIDDRILELDSKAAQLAELTRQADARIAAFKRLAAVSGSGLSRESAVHDADGLASPNGCDSISSPDRIPEAYDCTELARSLDLSAAEVKLMVRLADLGIEN